MEQRLDNKMDRILHEIQLMKSQLEERFRSLETRFEERFSFQAKLIWAIFIMLLGIIASAAVKYFVLKS